MDKDPSEYESLLVRISEDYYLEDINPSEIAKKYEITRYKVLKYLEEAKEKNIVSIAINTPIARNYEIENIFKKYFKTNVYILKENEDLSHQDQRFYRFAAEYIQGAIRQAKIVSLSWGDSIYKVIDQFRLTSRKDLVFTQFIGEIGKYNSLAGSTRLVQKASDRYDSSYLTLNVPLYIINDTARELMSLEPSLSQTLATAIHSDILISGIGTLASIESVGAWNKHKKILFPNMDQATGFIFGRPFTSEGNFSPIIDDKTFGLALKEILAIPQRIGICNNKFKAEACLGVLRAEALTDLFLDEKIAGKILSLLDLD